MSQLRPAQLFSCRARLFGLRWYLFRLLHVPSVIDLAVTISYINGNGYFYHARPYRHAVCVPRALLRKHKTSAVLLITLDNFCPRNYSYLEECREIKYFSGRPIRLFCAGNDFAIVQQTVDATRESSSRRFTQGATNVKRPTYIAGRLTLPQSKRPYTSLAVGLASSSHILQSIIMYVDTSTHCLFPPSRAFSFCFFASCATVLILRYFECTHACVVCKVCMYVPLFFS